MRNFFLALLFSIGTPMIHMGDEYGHTRGGNNNAYCLDNKKNYFLWDKLEQDPLYKYVKKLIELRKSLPQLQRKSFLTDGEIVWHGHHVEKPNWGEENRFIALTLKGEERDIYLAFNAHFEPAHLILERGQWKRLIDTSLEENEEVLLQENYTLPPYSSLLLIS